MVDPIPSVLFFLQSHSAFLPFTRLEIKYQDNYYPIVLPRAEKIDSIARGFTHYGMMHQYSRIVIMQNVLKRLSIDEWVTFVANEERNEFVQYARRRSPFFTIRPKWREYLFFILIRIPRLYPGCYFMEFLQPKTKIGRTNLARAVGIIHRYGCTPRSNLRKEYEVTGVHPRCYILIKDVPKMCGFRINCGPDPMFAAMLGDVLLTEVLQNQDPVMVRIGEWGK